MGVNAIKAPFASLNVRLPADSYRRYRIITLAVHLFKFRTRLFGLNQIKTVYANIGERVQPWVLEMLNYLGATEST